METLDRNSISSSWTGLRERIHVLSERGQVESIPALKDDALFYI